MGSPEKLSQRVLFNTIKEWKDFGFTKEEQTILLKNWMKNADLLLPKNEIDKLVERVYSQPHAELNHEVNLKVVSTALGLSGWNKEQIEEVLLRKTTIEKEAAAGYAQDAGKKFVDSSNAYLSEKDWIRFNTITGINEKYPWKIDEMQIYQTEAKEEILDVFRSAKLIDTIAPSEANWTGFCMAVALKQLDVPADERNQIMTSWANKNSVYGMSQILDTVERDETNFLRKPTWEKVITNLNIKSDYPWTSTEEIRLVKNELQASLLVMSTKEIFQGSATTDDKKWALSKMNLLFEAVDTEPSEIESKLRSINETAKVFSEKELMEIRQSIPRTEDIEVMRKQLGLKDTEQQVVSNFAKVMFAAGLSSDSVNQTIHEWNRRSEANIDPDKLAKIIATAEKHCLDIQTWGRTPVVSKKEFQHLCKELSVNAPWMWKSDRVLQSIEKDSFLSIGQSLWKSIWKGLEQERSQNEAKGEMMRKQQAMAMARQIARSEEQER